MAFKEFYIGTNGPYFIDEADPLFTDPGQVVTLDRLPVSSVSVVEEREFGLPSDAGIGSSFSRNDHTHGTPDLEIGNVNFTADGGVAVKLINKTGAASVKGTVVQVDSGTDSGVAKIVVDVPNPMGVIYSDGVADGEEIWVVVSGKAYVYFVGNVTRGDIVRGFVTADGGSYVSGQALAETYPTAPFASDKHFYEIGHALESRTGAGLALSVLHFN